MPRLALPQPLLAGQFRRRLNRFAAQVVVDGRTLLVHVPNSGRMTELLVPGAPIRFHPYPPGRSRTAGRLLLVWHEGRWVSVDASLPNRLFEVCLAERALPFLTDYTQWEREVPWGHGRLDFLLRAPDQPALPPCLVETKSCNLVEDGIALFPDAPTARGTRHVQDLVAALAQGYRAALVFFIQRDDARLLRPHRQADPAFAAAVRSGAAAGLGIHALRCRVEPAAVTVLDTVTVEP